MGFEINIGDIQYSLDFPEGKPTVYWRHPNSVKLVSGQEPEEVWFLYEHTLSQFLRECLGLTNDDLFSIVSNMTLTAMKREKAGLPTYEPELTGNN